MSVYKCPVCEGRGQVPAGFYYTTQSPTVINTCPETCKSCDGKGVIFDTDCFYPHTNSPLPDGYSFDSCANCANCEHNDRTAYTSTPVKYKCTLSNVWHEGWYRHEGDRIAQLVIMPYLPVVFTEVDKLGTTDRGDGGFGSTDNDNPSDYVQMSLFDAEHTPCTNNPGNGV